MMNNIPGYRYASFSEKILFKLGLKKSDFISPNFLNDDHIIINENTVVKNLQDKEVTLKGNTSLIIENIKNVRIKGSENSTIYLQGTFDGEIDTKGRLELYLQSVSYGNIKCGRLIIHNNKKDQSKNPSIEGNVNMYKKK